MLKLLNKYDDSNQIAISSYKETITYKEFLKLINSNILECNEKGITSKNILFKADYSISSISLLFALLELKNTVLLTTSVNNSIDKSVFNYQFEITDNIKNIVEFKNKDADHPLIKNLKENQQPGLVLLTSGSTGEPKYVLHDFEKFVSKFDSIRKSYKTLAFMLFDHVSGLDTLLYTLLSGSELVLIENRKVETVFKTIEDFKVEVLPTSPTFVNMMLLDSNLSKYNLNSLKIITLGSEKLSNVMVHKLESILNEVKIVQKYGSTEFGSPISRTNQKDKEWIEFDPSKTTFKIKDNILFLKTTSSMIGYLNFESPFDEEGYFNTGDEVVLNGNWIKILGRKSEIINVGGNKVYPSEVENIITEIEEVIDAKVYGSENPLMGKVVAAKVFTLSNDLHSLKNRIRKECLRKLDKYKTPVILEFTDKPLHSIRFKK